MMKKQQQHISKETYSNYYAFRNCIDNWDVKGMSALLEAGLDVNYYPVGRFSLVECAMKAECTEAVELLVKHGLQLRQVVWAAVDYGCMKFLQELAAEGLLPQDEVEEHQGTPLEKRKLARKKKVKEPEPLEEIEDEVVEEEKEEDDSWGRPDTGAEDESIWGEGRDYFSYDGRLWERCDEMHAANRVLEGEDKEAGFRMFQDLESHGWGCVAFRAKYILGWCYLGGLGVEEDLQKARAAFHHADNFAYRLYINYKGGYCPHVMDQADSEVEDDLHRIIELLEDFDADAHYKVACAFLDDYNTFYSEEAGIRWLQRAAEMGSVEAMADLGVLYLENGDSDSLPAAKELLIHAAGAGSKKAGEALGGLCCRSITAEMTQADAAQWYPIAARYATDKTLGILLDIAAKQGRELAPECLRMGRLCAHRPGVAERWFLLAAEHGFAPAQLELAHVYKAGMPRKDAPAQYLQWLQEAAEQGLAEARNELGECYRDGVCLPVDACKAHDLFRQAAAQGCVPAQRNYAWSLLPVDKMGAIFHFTRSLPAEAADLVRRALAPGNAKEMCRVSVCYQFARAGFPQNDREAERWLALTMQQMAAEHADAAAVHAQAGRAQDSEERFVLLTMAAHAGYAPAQFELSQCYADKCSVFHHPGEEKRWCTLAAEQDYPPAQFHLAMQGDGKWLLPAAEHGYTEAQCDVADKHHDAQEYGEAFQWYTKAAEQGFPRAQFELAEYYRWGRGVQEDPQQAFQWYFSAAQAGDPQAQYRLGECYRRGYGVEKDPDQADRWTKAAAATPTRTY